MSGGVTEHTDPMWPLNRRPGPRTLPVLGGVGTHAPSLPGAGAQQWTGRPSPGPQLCTFLVLGESMLGWPDSGKRAQLACGSHGRGDPCGTGSEGSGIHLEPSRLFSPAPGGLAAGLTASELSSPAPVCVAGRVGLWKDIFTVSMNEKFDLVYKQKMGKCDLTFDFYL